MGVHWANSLAESHAEWSREILDVRTLLPWDEETVFASVRKTNRALILHEDTLTGGIGGEISSRIHEACWNELDVPVARVASLDTPFPFIEALEKQFLANSRLEAAVAAVLKE
jgi:2-oxoisovalerate dehydrogenase E1 component